MDRLLLANSDRFSCLVCSDAASFYCGSTFLHIDHPKQELVSDDLLLANLDTNKDDPSYSEVKIFNCPYCDRPKLSVSGLYDHLTLEHLDITFNVRCPICVCFGENQSVLNNMHLSEHIVAKHSTSFEQYETKIQNANEYNHPGSDLLKFIASTLPPTYYGATASPKIQSSTPPVAVEQQIVKQSVEEDNECSICWETFSNSNSRQLICKHTFHNECIQKWLVQNKNCPICRKPAP